MKKEKLHSKKSYPSLVIIQGDIASEVPEVSSLSLLFTISINELDDVGVFIKLMRDTRSLQDFCRMWSELKMILENTSNGANQ